MCGFFGARSVCPTNIILMMLLVGKATTGHSWVVDRLLGQVEMRTLTQFRFCQFDWPAWLRFPVAWEPEARGGQPSGFALKAFAQHPQDLGLGIGGLWTPKVSCHAIWLC